MPAWQAGVSQGGPVGGPGGWQGGAEQAWQQPALYGSPSVQPVQYPAPGYGGWGNGPQQPPPGPPAGYGPAAGPGFYATEGPGAFPGSYPAPQRPRRRWGGLVAGVVAVGVVATLAALAVPKLAKQSEPSPSPRAAVTSTVRVTPATPAPPAPPVALTSPALVDTQPGVGTKLHAVRASAQSPIKQGWGVIVWIANADASGAPNRQHEFPYAVLAAGETRDITLDVGDVGTADVGHTFIAEACTVQGVPLARANAYLTSLATHAPDEANYRTYGIDVSLLGGSIDCQPNARLVLKRTE